MLDLHQAWNWLAEARWVTENPTPGACVLSGVSTDTRSVGSGQLFVALRGERFDAHAFIGQALQAGAAALLVDHLTPECRPPLIQVRDTRRALGEIARGWRRQFSVPVIGVTGSNGKTTVKEMIAAILGEAHGTAHRLATRGNLNNEIGVPLTVLGLAATHRSAVIEMGMNRPGEIAWLAEIAQPTVALVNNAQREHQEFLHTVQATAIENGQALAALPADGVAVFPGDDPHTSIWEALAGARRSLRFGWTAGANLDVHASEQADPADFELTLAGQRLRIRLSISGRHNIRNALAAAACAHAAGIGCDAIAGGLAAFRPASGRLRELRGLQGARVIDDSYNANPDSVRAAIDVLAVAPTPRVLVLGDMAEVGDDGPRFHEEVGHYAREHRLEHLLACGPASLQTAQAFGMGAEHFADAAAVIDRARELAGPATTVLVKGSRSMTMERVVAALTQQTPMASGQVH
ncbi:MAG: UDP-N-acetylmuramoyl-tripeptide--D-alanyl-D-alanine ligase [Burkholderiales bacterium]